MGGIKDYIVLLLVIAVAFVAGALTGPSILPKSIMPVGAIRSENNMPLPDRVCEAIEILLAERLNEFPVRTTDAIDRFQKALIYSEMFANGCEENQEYYRAHALRELEIGQALLVGDNSFWTYRAILEVFANLNMTEQVRAMVVEARHSFFDMSPEQISVIESFGR